MVFIGWGTSWGTRLFSLNGRTGEFLFCFLLLHSSLSRVCGRLQPASVWRQIGSLRCCILTALATLSL